VTALGVFYSSALTGHRLKDQQGALGIVQKGSRWAGSRAGGHLLGQFFFWTEFV
jgi:hypothetical protein